MTREHVAKSAPAKSENSNVLQRAAVYTDSLSNIESNVEACIQQARGSGLPLPENVRKPMEKALGNDFSLVRVHTDEKSDMMNRTIQAKAFTTGQDIFFRKGTYKPQSLGGKELIAHELTHVVQQKSGKVSIPQGKGIPINVDSTLESEADTAAKKVLRGESVQITGASSGLQEKSAFHGAVIQCNFGFEIEIGGSNQWRVWADRGEKAEKKATKIAKSKNWNYEPVEYIDKGKPIFEDNGYQLQVEDNGKESTIEFVTNPPGLKNINEFNSTMQSIVTKAEHLETYQKGKKSFNAEKIGGGQKYRLKPGITMIGGLQVTAGVPLASIPALYEGMANLDSGGAEYQNIVENVRSQTIRQENKEFQGFLVLLRHYINQGKETNNRSFPKGVTKIMARTDFNKIFSLLPDKHQEIIVNNMNIWIKMVLGNDTAEADKPVLNQTFNYDETGKEPDKKIMVTRREWLENMPKEDLLAYNSKQKSLLKGDEKDEYVKKRSKDIQLIGSNSTASLQDLEKNLSELFQGMGGYGNTTDEVLYEGDEKPTEAVILEIRNPPTLGSTKTWDKVIRNMYNIVELAIQYPYGVGGKTGELLPKGDSSKSHAMKFTHHETQKQKQQRIANEIDKAIVKLIKESKGKPGKYVIQH